MNILLTQDTTLNEILHKLLTFIYFIAHQIGLWIIRGLQTIFSRKVFPDSIIDPLGFLIILTLFVLLVGISKRIAWIIITIGWILLLIRIILSIFQIA
jgi:hypothetical protein